jgi:hypothetical protein
MEDEDPEIYPNPKVGNLLDFGSSSGQKKQT